MLQIFQLPVFVSFITKIGEGLVKLRCKVMPGSCVSGGVLLLFFNIEKYNSLFNNHIPISSQNLTIIMMLLTLKKVAYAMYRSFKCPHNICCTVSTHRGRQAVRMKE